MLPQENLGLFLLDPLVIRLSVPGRELNPLRV